MFDVVFAWVVGCGKRSNVGCAVVRRIDLEMARKLWSNLSTSFMLDDGWMTGPKSEMETKMKSQTDTSHLIFPNTTFRCVENPL